MPSHWFNAHIGRAVRPWVGLATPPKPYKPLGLLARPLPPLSRNLLSLYQELGPSRHNPLAAGARSPSQLHNNITSLYDIWCSYLTTSSSSTFYVDTDGLLICPNQASLKKNPHVGTLAIMGATPRPLLYQGDVPGERPSQIAISLSSHLPLRCS